MRRIMTERRGEKFIPDIYIAGIATLTMLNQARSSAAACQRQAFRKRKMTILTILATRV